MPRPDDDLDDHDRPRRGRPRDEDEDDDRPARARRRRDDEDEAERPARARRRRDEDEDRPRKRKKSNVGLVLGILGGVFLLCCGGGGLGLYLFWAKVRGITGEHETTVKNFKEIGLAVHKHHDAVGTIPNNSYELRTGTALLSWRVHILPFLGEDALYKQFKLDEPWDSPNNRPLVARMPKVYGSAKANDRAGEGKTYYRGFSHVGAVFEKPRGPGTAPRLTFTQIPDGTMNTIFMVEAGEAVEWTRPDDIDWSPGRPRPALGGASPELPFCAVLMLDGSVRRLAKDVDDITLRHLIDRRDGNIIQPGWER
jgi:hypothetical protein